MAEDEMMDTDLRPRVVALEHKYAGHDQRFVSIDQRFSSIEQRLAQSDIADARKEEQSKNLLEKLVMTNEKIDGVKTDLHAKMDSLGGSIRWVAGLIIAAFVTASVGAVVMFVVKGGLNVS